MRRFKFVGTEEGAQEYRNNLQPIPIIGNIYNETDRTGGDTVLVWSESYCKHEWQEVFDEELPTAPDPVNPQHYKNGEVECIEGIKSAVVGKDGFAGYLAGNTLKYIWRYESKGGVQDLEKASWYLNKLIEHEKGKVK